MTTSKTNQSGFGAIELIIIVAVMAALGGVGFYVLHSKKAAPVSVAASTPDTSVTVPADWKTYDLTDIGVSIKAPSDWNTNGGGTSNNDYLNITYTSVEKAGDGTTPAVGVNVNKITLTGKPGQAAFEAEFLDPSGGANANLAGKPTVKHQRLTIGGQSWIRRDFDTSTGAMTGLYKWEGSYGIGIEIIVANDSPSDPGTTLRTKLNPLVTQYLYPVADSLKVN